MNSQILGMVIRDLLDVLIVDQILKQRAEVWCDPDLCCGDEVSSCLVDHWINVKSQSILKHPSECFQNSAFEIRVIFFVENLDQTGHAHHEPDTFVRVTKQISREPIIFAKLRDQDRSSQRTENIHASEKIGMIKLSSCEQILEGHLHENNDLFFRRIALRQKNAARAVQHIIRG